MSDEELIELAQESNWIIVTENIRHFSGSHNIVVLFVRKAWWPDEALASRLAAALDRWAIANPEAGTYPQWLDAEYR